MREEPAWTPELLTSPHTTADKASRVRRMFNAIAPRYALVNSLFSAGRDRYWRRRAVELAEVRADDEVLDVACGTGDFARAFAKAGPRRVVGVDFAHGMLVRAAGASEWTIGAATVRERSRRARDRPVAGAPGWDWVEGDALHLPFADGRFSIASCAFGVRNFADLKAGLSEMHRVLRPGGRVVILEFTRPKSAAVRRLYEFYANRLMPIAATWVSGDTSGAYRYLPNSVVSFLDAEQMCSKLHEAGFRRTSATPLTFGIVTVYVGIRD